MGVGAYACYKLTTAFPDVNIISSHPFVGVLLGRVGVLRPAVAADQGLLSRRRDAGGAVLPGLALQLVPWLYNYNSSGAIEVPPRTLFGVSSPAPSADPADAYLVVLTLVIGVDPDRQEHRARPYGRLWMASATWTSLPS